MSRPDFDLDGLLDAIADRVADRVVSRLGAHASTSNPYYSQNENPLGKRRFLEAARAKAFESRKKGKLVLARRDDVDRWLASASRTSPAPPTPTAPPSALDNERLLAQHGIVLDPPKRSPRR